MKRRTSVATSCLESLEARRLLAAVTVSGGSGSDTIRIWVSGSTILTDVNGLPQSYPDFLYDGIVVNAGNGADRIYIESNGDNSVTVNTGGGNDKVYLGDSANTLDGLTSRVTVIASDAFPVDEVYLNDAGSSSADTYTLAAGGVVNRGSFGGLVESGVALVDIDAGDGNDTFRADDFNTNAATRYVLRGSGGADTYDIRNTTSGILVIEGGEGADVVGLNGDFGAPASATIETTQDFAWIDSQPGGTLSLIGTAGVYLTTNLSNYEGDMNIDQGFLVERNSRAADGRGYWRERLKNAATGSFGPKLVSPFADASPMGDALGYGYGSDLATAAVDEFALGNNDLLVRYTLQGDADLDRDVDFEDLLRLAQNYGLTGNREWTDGDFDVTRSIDFDDLLALAQNYGQSAAVQAPARPALSARKPTTRVGSDVLA